MHASKQLSFSNGITWDGSTINFNQKQNKSLYPSKIRSVWIQLCSANQYESLRRYLDSAYEKGLTIEDLFIHEGKILLNWAIVIRPDAEPLKFICDNVPNNLLMNTLSNDNFHILESYLLGESALDQYNLTDHRTIESRIEKFRLLLNIDASGEIQSFIEKYMLEQSISKCLQANFKETLKQYKEQTVTINNKC